MNDDLISKTKVIEYVAQQYKAHGETIPEWLHIGDLPSVQSNSQPTDCIPRHVVINAITKIIRGAHPIEVAHQIFQYAQPERKKGKWIIVNESAGVYECDQCHERMCCVGKYCMNCGAPMEVEE